MSHDFQVAELIDSHCHLHDREFFKSEQAKTMLERARRAGVTKIVCIGTGTKDSLAARQFAEKHSGVYWTFGVHPEAARDEKTVHQISEEILELRTTIRAANLPVAIGEVGLDYHYPEYDRMAQIHLLEQMLQMAIDWSLPVSFHVREAFDDFFPIVGNFPKLHGVVHSFSDNKKRLRRILETTDFYVGVNGMATYSTLPLPPLSRILLETDAPFLTPVPFRGIINEPSYVREVANWLADRTEQSFVTIAKETTKHARRLFNI